MSTKSPGISPGLFAFVAYPVTDQLRTPESQTDIRDIPRRIACTKRAKKLTRFGALAPSADSSLVAPGDGAASKAKRRF